MTEQHPVVEQHPVAEKLGVSALPSQSDKAPKEPFEPIEFLGLYLLQYFVSALAVALISTFVVFPGKETVLALLAGENGGIDTLSLGFGQQMQIIFLGATLVANLSIVIVYLVRSRVVLRLDWETLGWKVPELSHTMRWVFLFYPLVTVFTLGYNLLLQWLGYGPIKQQVASFLSSEQPIMLRVFAVLLVLIAAPVTEEILYRGVLFRSLQSMFPLHLAAALSGIVFGLAHMQLATALPLAFLGYLLALAAHESRSLWLPIGLHTGNNLLAFLLVLSMSS